MFVDFTVCNIRHKPPNKSQIIKNNVYLFLWGFKMQTKMIHGFRNLAIWLWKSFANIVEGFCMNPVISTTIG